MADFGSDVSFAREDCLFRLRAAAVIIRDGCVMMMGNSRDDYLYSVGGAVQLGETAEDAVRREVLEETGLRLGIDRLLAVHQNFFTERRTGVRWHELAFYYLMGTPDEMPGAAPRSESMTGAKERAVWVPIRRYAAFNAYPRFFANLPRLLAARAPALVVTRE